MRRGSARLGMAALVLVALWIGVYWWTPTQPEPAGLTLAEPMASASRSTATSLAAPIDPRFGGGGERPVTHPSAAKPPAPKPEDRPPPPAETRVQREPGPTPRGGIIPPTFYEHTLEAGDSAERISRRYYGTPVYWQQVMRSNPQVDFKHLHAGRVIRVPKDPRNVQGLAADTPQGPGAPEAPAPAASPGPRQEYTVVSGDTLSGIAAQVYGKSALWTLIRDANRDKVGPEGENLKPGMVLVIPASPGAKRAP